MLNRSESGKYAKAIFYQKFNGVDVYIEDTSIESKKIFVEILRRVMGDVVSIADIFPIGPKSTVIKRCSSDQGERTRPAIYIVDGDYDALRSEPYPKMKRIYRIGRYCIENYLIDKDAILDIVNGEVLDRDRDQLSLSFDYDAWHSKVSEPLCNLTLALCVASIKQCDNLASVNIDLGKVRGLQLDHVDKDKVDELVEGYSSIVDGKHGDGAFDQCRNQLNVGGDLDYRYHCSGKSILMPLITSRIRRKTGVDLDYRVLKVKLAGRCDVSDLQDIKNYVC